MSPDFAPVPALAGGLLVGAAASLLLLVNGRVAGVSGMMAGLVRPMRGQIDFRVLFLAGLVIAGLIATFVAPGSVSASTRSLPVLAIAGLLVGAGTRLSHGCTSGHGICGVSRGSIRSLVAVALFVGAGMASASLFGSFAGRP